MAPYSVAAILSIASSCLMQARPLHHTLSELYDTDSEVQDLALRLERVRAEFEHQSPTPSGLELVAAENNCIKVSYRNGTKPLMLCCCSHVDGTLHAPDQVDSTPE